MCLIRLDSKFVHDFVNFYYLTVTLAAMLISAGETSTGGYTLCWGSLLAGAPHYNLWSTSWRDTH